MPRLNQADFYSTTLTAAVNGGSLEYFVETTIGGPASPCIIILNPQVPAKREIVRANGTFTGTKFASLAAGDRDLAGSGHVDHEIGDTVWVSVSSYDIDAIWDDIEAHEAAIGDIETAVDDIETDLADVRTTYTRLVAIARAESSQTGIGPSETDLTGLTVTHDTVAGHRYRYRAFLPHLSGTNGDIYQLRLTNAANVRAQGSNVRIAADGHHVSLEHITSPASDGSNTLKLRLIRIAGSGTVDLTAAGSLAAFLTAEDLGVL